MEESGEHIIAGCGELHMEICYNDLCEYAKCEIRKSDPVVSYRETIIKESSKVCLAKSPNKHNRIWVKAEPLSEEVSLAIENGDIGPKDDFKTRARKMEVDFGWDNAEARKIWSFGPDHSGPNVFVDCTK